MATRKHLGKSVSKRFVQKHVQQEVGGTVATDKEQAADFDLLEGDDGVVVVFGHVLSRVVPRDRVEDEKTDHDRDAQ